MKDVTYADYMHAKIVCKDFEIENLDEYHDLYHMLINPSRSLRGRGSRMVVPHPLWTIF